ncbi:hypothetical protein GUJ93_ZPchr0119g33228 [Zizania palustris]|uniref:CID domain-containing protein n=1 Tax=Zizania palustris TaxID=103762 RepID=A0A8J5VDG9_ZIZPA|nr:hypothetical protein GUJ93_ZPchr0119g33228 [Zizania palustris]
MNSSPFSEEILAEKLAKLNNTQQSIETLSYWCIFHRKNAEQIVQTWEKKFHSSGNEQKTPLLYVANDILQNSKRNGTEFVEEFWKVLPGALKDVTENGDDRGKNVVSRLVGIWQERRVFGSHAGGIKDFCHKDYQRDSRSVKLKLGVGGAAEKIVSALHTVLSEQTDEDADLENARSLCGMLERWRRMLTVLVAKLKVVEANRAAVVSELKEALQEQESELEKVRTQLQLAEAMVVEAANMQRRLKNEPVIPSSKAVLPVEPGKPLSNGQILQSALSKFAAEEAKISSEARQDKRLKIEQSPQVPSVANAAAFVPMPPMVTTTTQQPQAILVQHTPIQNQSPAPQPQYNIYQVPSHQYVQQPSTLMMGMAYNMNTMTPQPPPPPPPQMMNLASSPFSSMARISGPCRRLLGCNSSTPNLNDILGSPALLTPHKATPPPRRLPPPVVAGSPPRSRGGYLQVRSEPRRSAPLTPHQRRDEQGGGGLHWRSPAMLRRCVRDLYSLRSRTRIPRPISSEVPSPAFLQSRSKSTKASQQRSTQNNVPGPQGEPSQSGSNVTKVLLGTLAVGAAAMAAYQAGYIDHQFKDIIFPSNMKEQNITKPYEDLNGPSEQKVDGKQVESDPNVYVVQNGDDKAHPPKDLPTEGLSPPEIPTANEHPTFSEEKERETLDQGTLPLPDEHGVDTKLLSKDVPAVNMNPVVDDKATGEVLPEQIDNTTSTVSPVLSSPETAGPSHRLHTDTDTPKDQSGAGAVEHKSLAETYLLQEHDNSEDMNAKESRHGEVISTDTSDDGKIVLDIIEAIHAAERKQADTDAYMYSEEKRKLKDKYEKELKDTRARELMYAEEAAILEKELKKEKLKSVAVMKELQESAEQKLRDELQRKDEETGQEVEKVRELAKAELAAALAKEKASQIEQIAEANLNIDALCMAFYARSEETRQSHSVHKLALGTLALEDALSTGSPIRTEVDQLRRSLEGIDKDSLLELALSSLPEDVLEYGTDTPMELKQKFNSLKETIRHFSLIPAGGGIKEDQSGDGIESLINRVENLILRGELSAAAEALEGGLHGSEAAEIASEWVKQAKKRAIAEQTLALLHSYASSITFS